jgi:uncharacterized protein (DUF1697 family)
MPRYAAFLRGISPVNAAMADLRSAFEAAGFTEVKTVLSSGNVVFDARSASESSLQARAEAVMQERLGKAFLTVVRRVDALQAILASDPYRGFRVAPPAKRIITFLRDSPATKPKLPVQLGTARLLVLEGKELFSVYLPSPKGAEFMTLIEKTFGKAVTTRTWDTVTKVARRE